MRKRTYPRPCTQCGAVLDEDGFYVKYSATGARYSWCKACHSKRSVAWQKAHSEQINERRRERYVPHPRQRHPAAKLATKARYRERNRVKLREEGRLRYRLDPAPFKAALARRRARLRDEGFTVEEWHDLCARYGNRCLRCGVAGPLSPDHVVPLSKDGANTIANIQPLCWPCNSWKARRIIDYR